MGATGLGYRHSSHTAQCACCDLDHGGRPDFQLPSSVGGFGQVVITAPYPSPALVSSPSHRPFVASVLNSLPLVPSRTHCPVPGVPSALLPRSCSFASQSLRPATHTRPSHTPPLSTLLALPFPPSSFPPVPCYYYVIYPRTWARNPRIPEAPPANRHLTFPSLLISAPIHRPNERGLLFLLRSIRKREGDFV